MSLKLSKAKVAQSCLTLCDPTDYTIHGISPGQNTRVGIIPSPADLADPGIEPGSPALRVDSLPTEVSEICLKP